MNRRDGTLATVAVLLGIAVVSAGAAQRSAKPTQHPLDALTPQEYRTTVETLAKAAHVDESSRYPLIVLDEPDKDKVLAWKTGVTLPILWP